MRNYFVYILRCADGSPYIGMTNNLERRFGEHQSGLNRGCYTFERRPVKLVFSRVFAYVHDAIHFEKVVKDWSRKKKEALINGDIEALRLYAKKVFPNKGHRKLTGIRFRRLQQERFIMRKALHTVVVPRTPAVPQRATRNDNSLEEGRLGTLAAPRRATRRNILKFLPE